jgi:hypothetical protein
MNEERKKPGKVITFYSYKGGTGRTMALANVAWILASNGKRVLVVDWDLEAPGLHRYFHPFLVDPTLAGTTGVMDMVWDFALATLDPKGDASPGWHLPYAEVLNHTVSLRWDFGDGGLISMLAAGRQDEAYWMKVNSFSWKDFYEKRSGAAFIRAVRNNMVSRYDYVLIDSRTGVSDTAGICTAQIPDVLVDCFTYSTQSIEGAAAVAKSVLRERGDREIVIWPVPMHVEDGEPEKLQAGRDLARVRLDHLLARLEPPARDRYWGLVPVPYKQSYAYEETLAAIRDLPGDRLSMLTSYEYLTRYLTDGEITRLVPLPEPDRRRLAIQFERRPRRRRGEEPRDVFISYVDADRDWAEWMAYTLEDAGYPVRIRSWDMVAGSNFILDLQNFIGSATVIIAVTSRNSVASPQVSSEWQAAYTNDPDGIARKLVPVLIDPVEPPGVLREVVSVSLAGLDESAAARRLLDGVSGALRGRAKPPVAPTFPSAPPRASRQHYERRTTDGDQDRERPAGKADVPFPGAPGV